MSGIWAIVDAPWRWLCRIARDWSIRGIDDSRTTQGRIGNHIATPELLQSCLTLGHFLVDSLQLLVLQQHLDIKLSANNPAGALEKGQLRGINHWRWRHNINIFSRCAIRAQTRRAQDRGAGFEGTDRVNGSVVRRDGSGESSADDWHICRL